MFSRTYLCNIGWTIFLCNAESLSNNMAQVFYLCNVVPRVLRQHWRGFYLFMQRCLEPQDNIHKVFPMQSCLRRCSWDNIAQMKLCAVVPEMLQTTLNRKKIMCNVVLIPPGQHYTDKKPYTMLSLRLPTTSRNKSCAMLSQRLHTTLYRKKSGQCCLNNIWSLRLYKY